MCWGIILLSLAYSQTHTAESFGFRHLHWKYQNDPVEILIQSQKGEENIPKPILFFCQGSLPKPLLIYQGKEVYGTFPFQTDRILEQYHLVIVGKPYIPVLTDVNSLRADFSYTDTTGEFPKDYTNRNLLHYYVPRNLGVIRYLRKQSWVSRKQLVVAGHSEGSTIAAKMASESHEITHLIYSGGNPMGRIVSIITQSRVNETDTDSTRFGENNLQYWAQVIQNQTDISNRTMFEFSEPMYPVLLKLNIPVLVTYGTKDWCSPYLDFLRVEILRKKKQNITFFPYIGTEHNYFPVKKDNTPDYETFNWDKVANDWLKWLKLQPK